MKMERLSVPWGQKISKNILKRGAVSLVPGNDRDPGKDKFSEARVLPSAEWGQVTEDSQASK